MASSSQRPRAHRFPPPKTVLLGKYCVDWAIGEGGMGVVLKATHIELGEPVAIKVLLPEMLDRTEIVQRFLREARAAAKLKGNHVARVIDVGDLDGAFRGQPYIVMEYLEGADLRAIIKAHGPQDPAVAVDLILQACEAVAEAHSHGIIHRDIKASNFFITEPDGAEPCLKVLDFGIATAPTGESELTTTQSVIGTPAYMAPEQMRNSRGADARSDIWSMGVLLYEMLEAVRPFRSEAYPELCLRVGMDPPEPMVQPGIPEGLRSIVMKCLEKSPESRYQSIAELAVELVPFASSPSRARDSADVCTRLRARRSSPPMAAVGFEPGLPLTPPRLRRSRVGTAADVPSASQSVVKTPTSVVETQDPLIARASGRWSRRGIVVLASFLVTAVVGVGAIWLSSHRSESEAAPAPPPHAVAPPPHEVAPQAHEAAPQAHEAAPQAHAVAPPPHEVAPPPHEVVVAPAEPEVAHDEPVPPVSVPKHVTPPKRAIKTKPPASADDSAFSQRR
jgi:serine/threonine protein kinase